MKPIAIYGAGGLGKEICAMLSVLPEWSLVGFYDDGKPSGTVVMDCKVLGGLDELKKISTPLDLVIAIGNPQTKRDIFDQVHQIRWLSFPVLVHPQSILMDKLSISLGPGTVIGAGAILTTDIAIGSHVLININTTIGHGVRVGDGSSIMPGVNLAGDVKIGQRVLIGSGAGVKDNVSIGDDSKVGMGAVVLMDIPNNRTAVGVPARLV